MQPLIGRHAAVRRIGKGRKQLVELQRILEDRVHARRHIPPIALHHRIDGVELHLGVRDVLSPALDQAVQRYAGGRADRPLLDHRMLRGDLRAQELDAPQVLQRLRIDHHRREARAGVFVDDQLAVGPGDGPEEAGGSVRHRLDLSGLELVAVDVRDPGIVARPEQVLAIRREDEALGRRRPQLELRHRDQRPGVEIRDLVDPDRLVPVHLAHGSGEQRAVRRDVEVERDLPVGEGVDLSPAGVGRIEPDQGDQPVQVPQAPE